SSRGTPQIEVTFDIDANGILHVGAKDKATGKENKITIKANSGLTEDEIQKMVSDAALHADDDRKVKELAESRNQADALIHATRKSVIEYDGKLDAADKDDIDKAITHLETAIKSADKAGIDASFAALSGIAQRLGEKVHAGAAGSQETKQADVAPPHAGQDDAADADFEEVKEGK
ncbi:MAG: Hsp70 family protein, partial [Rhodoferax sp.]|nr:Hsp70 family protein [Rhodoferax sp.]